MAMDILTVTGAAAAAEPDPGVVHARAVCAVTVLNTNWDISAVRQPLADVEP